MRLRHNKAEKVGLAVARRVLEDNASSPREVEAALRIVNRIERAAQVRAIEIQAARRCGGKPQRANFSDEESFAAARQGFERCIETLLCESTLASPGASLANRARARKRLKELDRGEHAAPPIERRKITPQAPGIDPARLDALLDAAAASQKAAQGARNTLTKGENG